ncbi:MAG: flagellar filament outer layer protein FlaA [Leptospirales bacterium]|nr:flagellar filament outer layer protein FlaA [Leptospirales bacterium]
MNLKDVSKKCAPLGLSAALAVGLAMLHSPIAAVETAIGSDVSSHELRAITIESWDKDYSNGGYGWEAVTNVDPRPQPNETYKAALANLKMEREVKLIAGTPRDIRENQNYPQARVFGLKFAFTFPGNNVVSLRPPRVDHYMVERARPHLNETALADSNYRIPSCFQDQTQSQYSNPNRPVYVDCVIGVDMPGQVKALSVWVMGRGNEYELEAWIDDWKGETHILKFGSVDFIGWRPLTVSIPNSVPQGVDSFPAVKTLVFRQFKLRATPRTSLEPVYIFFDELRVLTDVFEVHFDGATLDFDRPDCERKNRLYRLIRENARNPEAWPELVDCSKAPGPAQAGGGGGTTP